MTGASAMSSDYLPESPLGVFTIEIATPGGSSADWRPFSAQELTLSEYARKVIERFEFKAEVIDLNTDRDGESCRPGIILIDPRFMNAAGGRPALEAAVARLPKWIRPMLIVGQPDDASTQDLADQARDILSGAGALRARSAARSARGVTSLRAFSLLVRDLMFEAEEQYKLHRSKQRFGASVPSHPSGGRAGSPSPSRSDRLAATPNRLGETPDAR